MDTESLSGIEGLLGEYSPRPARAPILMGKGAYVERERVSTVLASAALIFTCASGSCSPFLFRYVSTSCSVSIPLRECSNTLFLPIFVVFLVLSHSAYRKEVHW